MRTILIATDFSEPALKAADYAVGLARFFAGKLILAHACAPATGAPGVSNPGQTGQLLRERLQKMLEDEKQRLQNLPGTVPEVECILVEGEPLQAIRLACDKHGAELVVAGMEGSTGALKKYLIGSTALQLATSLQVPTLIVPRQAVYKTIQKITYACDLDFNDGTAILHTAKALAHAFGARLELMNVKIGVGERESVSSEALVFVEEALHDTPHTTILLHNDDAADSLVKHFMTHQTDLLLLHPKKNNLFYRLFNRGVSTRLAYRLKLPMLLVR